MRLRAIFVPSIKEERHYFLHKIIQPGLVVKLRRNSKLRLIEIQQTVNSYNLRLRQ